MKRWKRKLKNRILKYITFVVALLVIVGITGLDGPRDYVCSIMVSWGVVWIFAFYKANWGWRK